MAAVKSFLVHSFISPFDSSGYGADTQSHPCSYAANAQVFLYQLKIEFVRDGSSNTIFFAEHYAKCADVAFVYSCPAMRPWGTLSADVQLPAFAFGRNPPWPGARQDYFPITSGNPPVSVAADGVTFQVRVKPQDCDPRQANTGDPSGMPCAMGDGSVRSFSKSVRPEVFWAAVTPSGGELPTD